MSRSRVHWAQVAGRLAAVGWIALTWSALAAAQSSGVHPQYSAEMPPGAIGSWQLRRGGPLPGYFQPVEIRAPEGVEISLAVEGQFTDPRPAPLVAGLLIAPVYRLKVTGIEYHEGEEVYPSIEVIDRLYPPPGQERRFPIPVELTADELEMALEGKYVVRVIYLEEPDAALPVAEEEGHTHWMEAGSGSDPFEVADLLGRPVAILRMGGRLPLDAENDLARSCAPLVLFPPAASPPELLPPPQVSP